MMINKKHANITDTNNIFQPLLKMGWDSHFQTHLDNICNEKVFPARVVGVQKNSFLISQGNSESLATTAGKLNHQKGNLTVEIAVCPCDLQSIFFFEKIKIRAFVLFPTDTVSNINKFLIPR